MLELDGWCPFIVSGIVKSYGLTTIHYCATLGGPTVRLNHRKCSETLCLPTRNINATHCKPECGCLTLKPDVEKMVSVIRREETPVLRYRIQDQSEALEIEAASKSVPY